MYTQCLSYNSKLQSHMVKNSEWGAIVYLSKSIYGKNAKVISNTDYYRCSGGGEGKAYIQNIGQSTTGNVTGVYDMSGGSSEFVAAYLNQTSSSQGTNLYNGASHLKNIYNKESDKDKIYRANANKYGDALYEISTNWNINAETAWWAGGSSICEATYPFLFRSTGKNDNGLFAFRYDQGVNANRFS